MTLGLMSYCKYAKKSKIVLRSGIPLAATKVRIRTQS